MIEARETQDLNLLEDEAFRLHVRAWIEAEYPAELRNPPKRLHWDENKPWYFKMAEKGWLCPGWPREFGGLGLSPAKQIIFTEEVERHGCARTNDHGIVMVGPLLINHGFCQRFSPVSISGARAIPNPMRGRIWQRSARKRCWMAIPMW